MQAYHLRPWQRAEDTMAVYELAAQVSDEQIGAAALPYQLSSWASDDPDNLALWTTPDGTLIAFAFFQVPFSTVHYAVHPHADQARLEDAIFDWSKVQATTLAKAQEPHSEQTNQPAFSFSIWPAESQKGIHARLEAHGFARQEVGRIFFGKSLTAPPPAPTLPPGFVVRPLAGMDEVAAATELLCAGFNICNFTQAWRQNILAQPFYRPELDWSWWHQMVDW
jgi:mycothiol synthase